MSADTHAGDARTEAAELRPQPASFHELKAALPGADAAFICQQMEANATVAQAQAAWLAELGRRNQALAAERDAIAKDRDDIKAAAAARPGVEPLAAGARSDAADGDGDDDDEGESEAESKFHALVDKEQERLVRRRGAGAGSEKPGQLPLRARAMLNVAQKHPQLHRELVAEANHDFVNGLPRVFTADPLAGLDPRKQKRGRKRA